VSLSEIAADFVEFMQAKALGKPEWKSKMKDFMNKRKAEPWYDYEEQRTEDVLRQHCDDRPRGVVPSPYSGPIYIGGREFDAGTPRIATLLAGADTQKGYFRYVVRAFGWGDEQESWLVQCGSLPTLEAVERQILQHTFHDVQGNEYSVERLLIDAMGHRTTEVYNFARRYRARVLATQGKQHQNAPVKYSQIDYFPQSKKPIPGGLKLGTFDTTVFKDSLAAKLEVQPGDPGAFWLHAEKPMPKAYFDEMTTEYWDNEAKAWICPPGKANHFWDCEVLCLAAAWELDIRRRRPQAEKQKSIPRPQTAPQASRGVGMGSRPLWF
jgi:phage terminase large subunit GpA-like protein